MEGDILRNEHCVRVTNAVVLFRCHATVPRQLQNEQDTNPNDLVDFDLALGPQIRGTRRLGERSRPGTLPQAADGGSGSLPTPNQNALDFSLTNWNLANTATTSAHGPRPQPGAPAGRALHRSHDCVVSRAATIIALSMLTWRGSAVVTLGTGGL